MCPSVIDADEFITTMCDQRPIYTPTLITHQLPPLPEGYVWQPASPKFNFSVVTESRGFARFSQFAQDHALVDDVCIYGEGLGDDGRGEDGHEFTEDDFLYVIQKSKLWLTLRAQASGTGSSMGKYLNSPSGFPPAEQVAEAWRDKKSHAPFTITTTMAGHMRWGNGYEDPALIHFAVDNYVRVVQVGTVVLHYSFIKELVPHMCREGLDGYILVSPDGVVYPAGSKGLDGAIGMLEIKCMSPFHHVAEADGRLTWVDNMERRQWYKAEEIPFVYVIQISLQALAGIARLNDNGKGLTVDSTMWFIRWSPAGFSEFSICFGDLIALGAIATTLYLSLLKRIHIEDVSGDGPDANYENARLNYNAEELALARILQTEYKRVIATMTHRYVDLAGLYPEFFAYRDLTALHRFVVPTDNR